MRAPVARSLGLAALLLAGAASGSSSKASARLELERSDDARSCIDSKRLARGVERRLRRRVFDPNAEATLFVHVTLQRREDEFAASIELSDATGVLGRRELTTAARHCSALDDSLALVVALLVESPPERAEPVEQSPAKPESSRTTRPPGAVQPAPAAAPREQTPKVTPSIEIPRETLAPREPFRFALRASALGGVGLLPGVALGPELGLAVRPPHGPWIVATLEAYLSHTESASADAGARLARQRLGLEICAPEVGISSLSLCFGQRLGAFSASGFGFDHTFERRVVTFAFGAGPDLTFPLGRYFAAMLGARLEVPVSRHRFDAALRDGSVHDLFAEPPVAATLRAGLGGEL